MRKTRCAEVGRRREHGFQIQGKDEITLTTPKGLMSRMKRWKDLECKIRIKGPYTSSRGYQRSSREGFRIGVCEESNRDVQRVAKGERLGSVEGWIPPGAEEQTNITSNVSVRVAGNV
jgi:hypothetical protein